MEARFFEALSYLKCLSFHLIHHLAEWTFVLEIIPTQFEVLLPLLPWLLR